MAIHHPTPPFGGGERPRLPSAQVGPVTQAIRAMRAADHCTPRVQSAAKLGRASPTFDRSAFTHGIRALSRTEVENLVEGLIDLLDAMDGDTDREADFADVRKGRDGTLHTIGCASDDEPSLCGLMAQSPSGMGDDREEDTADHEASFQPLQMSGGGYAVTSFGRSA